MKNLIQTIALTFAILCTSFTAVETFANDPVTRADAEAMLKKIEMLATENPVLAKIYAQQVIDKMVALNNSGELQPVLRQVFQMAHLNGMLPVETDNPDVVNGLADQAYGMIDATFISRGMTNQSRGQKYKSWDDLDNVFQKRIKSVLNNKPVPSVKDSKFMFMMGRLTGAAVRKGNLSEPLIDGPISFKFRKSGADTAEKNLTMITWAVYDDMTGMSVYEDLKAAVQRNIKVRVMVDGQTAKKPGYNSVLGKMEEAGIDVIYYFEKEALKKYFGQHRKMFIRDDGKDAIIGGMNPGDVYSHMNDEKDKWRDTDVAVKGPIAQDAFNLAAKLWNQQIKLHNLDLTPMKRVKVAGTGTGDEFMSLINHSPTAKKKHNVYLSNILAIRAARKSIKIENAYVILTPTLAKELAAAIQRGVEVTVLSNSDQSVDEPIVSRPIMASLKDLAAMGANVYMRKGTTLHSKFMIVDDHLLLIGSHNMHPRSTRYEGEVQLAIYGGRATGQLVEQYKQDIHPRHAIKISSPDDIVLPPDFLNGLPTLIFFDFL